MFTQGGDSPFNAYLDDRRRNVRLVDMASVREPFTLLLASADQWPQTPTRFSFKHVFNARSGRGRT